MKRAKKRKQTLHERAVEFALNNEGRGYGYMPLVHGYESGWKAAQRAARKAKPRNTRSKK